MTSLQDPAVMLLEDILATLRNYYVVDTADIHQQLYSVSEDLRFQLLKTTGLTGNSILQNAAFSNKTDLVKTIIYSVGGWQRTALLNQKNPFGNTAIDLAVVSNHIDVISLLLDSVPGETRITLLMNQKYFGTPLHSVAYRGFVEALDCIMSFLSQEEQEHILLVPNCHDELPLDVALQYNQALAVNRLGHYMYTKGAAAKPKYSGKCCVCLKFLKINATFDMCISFRYVNP